jgi:hypothetical protein
LLSDVSQQDVIRRHHVATKFCTFVVGEKLRKKIATLSDVTIVGTLAGSAGMNVYAFAAQATNPYALAAAVALGLAPFGLPGDDGL